jgi:hypothetical protein
MKTIFYFITVCILLASCSTEESAAPISPDPTLGGNNGSGLKYFEAQIRNDTNSFMDWETAYVNGVNLWLEGLGPGEYSSIVEYEAAQFDGINNPWAEIRFVNGKGYFCDLSGTNSQLCDDNKSLVHGTGFVQQPDGTWLYTITQDDYDNAFVLP